MNEPVWMDPPSPGVGGGRIDWNVLLEPLMAHPKRWALVRETTNRSLAGANAQSIRNRHIARRLPGTWEATSRKLADDRFAVFARYMGEDE